MEQRPSIDDWFARFAALSQPCLQVAPTHELTSAEKMPAAPGWPPMGVPWMNQLDGLGPPLGTNPFQPVVAPAPVAEPPLPDPRLKAVRGVQVGKSARPPKPSRPCRMAEVDKLHGRIDALERMLRDLSAKIDQQKSGPHQPSAPGATRGAKIRMRGPDSEHTSGANVDVSVADAEMLQYLDLDEIARAIGMPAGDA